MIMRTTGTLTDRRAATFLAALTQQQQQADHARSPGHSTTPLKFEEPLSPSGRPPGYLVKYQFSGLMLSVVLCGVTPRRLLAISVSW